MDRRVGSLIPRPLRYRPFAGTNLRSRHAPRDEPAASHRVVEHSVRHAERDCRRIVTMHFIWLAHRNTRRSIRLMRQPQATSRISPQEYLRRELASDSKSEYLDGKNYRLSGSLRPGAKLLRDACAMHCLIECNVIGDLHRQLKIRPETVFGSELRPKVAATGFETTPDASVYHTDRI